MHLVDSLSCSEMCMYKHEDVVGQQPKPAIIMWKLHRTKGPQSPGAWAVSPVGLLSNGRVQDYTKLKAKIRGLYHKPKKPERCTTFAQREKIRAKVRPQFKARRGWDDDTHLDYDDSDACSLYTLELQGQKLVAGLWISQSARILEFRNLVTHPSPTAPMVHRAQELHAELVSVFAQCESLIALRDFKCSPVIQELVLALAQMEEHVFGPQQPALTPHRRPVPPIEPLGMGRSPLVDRFSKMFEPTARQPVQPRTAHSSHAREARTSRSHHIDEAQGERDWSSTVDVLKNNEKQKALTQRQEAQARHRSAKSHRRHLKAVKEHDFSERKNVAVNQHTLVPNRSDLMFEDRKQQLAALKIQQMTRRRHAREKTVRARTQRDAAIALQRVQRGKAGRKKATEERSLQVSTNAATKIQAIQRGKMGRQRTQGIKVDKAVIKIQSLHRGNQGRNKVAEISSYK